ncbi:hypothetical protein [Bacillus albus]|uniref:hypothetical protein n=1 Tax=Bacillus albus TaxID=2026189 RepID=UPI0012F7A660|nr:hypothetical protein [Bacillus albus]
MKLTLFTISNEQIKEQLSKLQTKVDSLEAVKDVQDKIISAKDSQISFLNDSIANMWAPIGIVAGIAGIIASGAFIYVTYLNQKAKKKIEQGEIQLTLVDEKMKATELQIEQANNLIRDAQNTTINAQEKLEKLDQKQIELDKITNSTINNQKLDMKLRNTETTLEMIGDYLNALDAVTEGEKSQEYQALIQQQKDLEKQCSKASTDFQIEVMYGGNINYQLWLEQIGNLYTECNDLLKKSTVYGKESRSPKVSS